MMVVLCSNVLDLAKPTFIDSGILKDLELLK